MLARDLESMVAKYTLRQNRDGTPFVTESGNIILDCHFGPIAEARQLIAPLNSRAGIVGHGLFIGLAIDSIVAGASGVHYCTRRA
ncbi:MAG: hypothetical protein E3K36_01920 [Candidatus Brocadia sp.]|nr:hypothetical protein [Candidatus Brocadia sp.]